MGNKHPKLRSKFHTRDTSCFLCKRFGYGSICRKLSSQCLEAPFLSRNVPPTAPSTIIPNLTLPMLSNFVQGNFDVAHQHNPKTMHLPPQHTCNTSIVSSTNSPSKQLTPSQYAALYPLLCKPSSSGLQSSEHSGDEPNSELSSVDYSSLIPAPNSEFDSEIPSDLVEMSNIPSDLADSNRIVPTAYLQALNLNRVHAHRSPHRSKISPNFKIIANQPYISLRRCDHMLSPFWKNSAFAVSERFFVKGSTNDSDKNSPKKYSIFSTGNSMIKSGDPRRKYTFSESKKISAIKTKRSKVNMIHCKLCFMHIPNNLVLKQHMDKHELGQVNYCQICCKNFKHHSSYVKHKEIHNSEKQSSKFCNVSLTMKKSEVSLESKNNTKQIKLVCQICQKSYKILSDLRKHQLTHSYYNSITCDICNKSFSRQSNLTVHRRLHFRNDNNSNENVEAKSSKKSPIKILPNADCEKMPPLESIVPIEANKNCSFSKKSSQPSKTERNTIIDMKSNPQSEIMIKPSYNKNISSVESEKMIKLSNNKNISSVGSKAMIKPSNNKKISVESDVKTKSSNNRKKSSVRSRVMIKSLNNKKNSLVGSEVMLKPLNNQKLLSVGTSSDSGTSNEKIKCRKCCRIFSTKSSLQKHLPIHVSLTNRQTIVSMKNRRLKPNNRHSKKQKQVVKIKLPLKFKSLVQSHKCTVCSKSFVNKLTSKTNNYKCKACSEGSNRHPHNDVVLKEESAICKCETCGATFSTLSACKNHMKFHSSERDLDCKFCEKSFKDSSLYIAHMKTHTKVPDYHECPVCNRKYFQKMNMKRHVAAQHKSYPVDKL